jgi:flagellar hook-associated protein 2
MTTISSGTTSTAATTSTTASTATPSTTTPAATTSTATTGGTSTATNGAITISGVGSGIDTASIVTALVNAEKAPKQSQIDKQTLIANTSLTALGQLTSALDTYRTAIKDMNTSTGFSGLTSTSSSENTATVTVDGTASAGTYTLVVDKLATASKTTSGVFTGKSAAIVNTSGKAADLTIRQNNVDTKVSIPSGATLSQARDAINTVMAGKGITANILTDATGSRLVMSSTTTGVGTEITVTPGVGLDTNLNTASSNVPQNAEYTLDGIAMSSTLNTVAAAVSGVNIKLTGTGTSTINVGTDTTELKKKVTTFVDAYNALMTQMKTLTKVSVSDAGATSGGGLTGDATVRHMMSAIRNELVSSSDGSGITLATLGIATDGNTGLLKINDTKWNAAVADNNNVAAVQKLFTGSKGMLTRMTDATAGFAGSGGILAQRTTTLNTAIGNLSEQQTKLNSRIATLQSTLTAKYTAMDTLVAQLNATSKSVLSTLEALNNSDD